MRRPATAFLLLALFAPVAVQACSSATRYRVLSFFIDGVPDPNAPPPDPAGANESAAAEKPDTTAKPKARRTMPTIFRHQPYAKRDCGGCHVAYSNALIATPETGLCARCHGDVTEALRYVHGPVAVNACLECHHYHQSPHPGMALEAGSALCFRCHDSDELSKGSHHAEAESPDASCLQCHHPHGGENRMFLKQEAALTGADGQ